MSNRGGFVRNALGIFLVSVCAYAQSTGGRLSGTISDPQGAKVPGASVVVLNPVTGQMIETVANERGDYVIPALAPATYRVTVSLAGFKTALFQDVKIDTDVPVTLNVTLGLGAVSETVEVTATAEILKVIASSPSDTTPVFEAIAGSAKRLLDAFSAAVFRFDSGWRAAREWRPARGGGS